MRDMRIMNCCHIPSMQGLQKAAAARQHTHVGSEAGDTHTRGFDIRSENGVEEAVR